jgi:hypothetical protein
MPSRNEAISICWLATGRDAQRTARWLERGASAIIRAQRALHSRTCL